MAAEDLQDPADQALEADVIHNFFRLPLILRGNL